MNGKITKQDKMDTIDLHFKKMGNAGCEHISSLKKINDVIKKYRIDLDTLYVEMKELKELKKRKLVYKKCVAEIECDEKYLAIGNELKNRRNIAVDSLVKLDSQVGLGIDYREYSEYYVKIQKIRNNIHVEVSENNNKRRNETILIKQGRYLDNLRLIFIKKMNTNCVDNIMNYLRSAWIDKNFDRYVEDCSVKKIHSSYIYLFHNLERRIDNETQDEYERKNPRLYLNNILNMNYGKTVMIRVKKNKNKELVI